MCRRSTGFLFQGRESQHHADHLPCTHSGVCIHVHMHLHVHDTRHLCACSGVCISMDVRLCARSQPLSLLRRGPVLVALCRRAAAGRSPPNGGVARAVAGRDAVRRGGRSGGRPSVGRLPPARRRWLADTRGCRRACVGGPSGSLHACPRTCAAKADTHVMRQTAGRRPPLTRLQGCGRRPVASSLTLA